MKKEIYHNLDYFNNLLEEFITKEHEHISIIGEGIEKNKDFKFFLSVLIHSIYDDSSNYIEMWVFMTLKDMVDQRYLRYASNYSFVKKIKNNFQKYFEGIKI